jgi:sugar/nucleoside kinase (ribokinase family)
VIGEIGVDILVTGCKKIPQAWAEVEMINSVELLPAGAGGYSAMTFSKLGGECRLVGRIGDDHMGHFLLDMFRKKRVNTRFLDVDRKVATEVSLILVFEDKTKASLCTEIPSIDPKYFDADCLIDMWGAHFSGYLLFPNLWKRGIRSIMGEAKNRGLHTSLDPQMSLTGEWMKPFNMDLSFLDILFIDEEEVQRITNEDHIEKAAAKLLKKGVEVVVVKMGEKGCYVKTREESFETASYPVKAVSTVGAGDAFDAAFLYARSNGRNLRWASEFANLVAAYSVTKIGCIPGIPSTKRLLNQLQKEKRTIPNYL